MFHGLKTEYQPYLAFIGCKGQIQIAYTVRNIIPAVPGLWKDLPIVGKENLQKIRLNESKMYLGVSISLLVEERIIFGLF